MTMLVTVVCTKIPILESMVEFVLVQRDSKLRGTS